MKKGVIYCAVGNLYIREAIHSAKSLRKYNPGINLTLFTTTDILIKSNVFDIIKYCPNNYHPWKQKVWCILNSPYCETLYLDTDTEIHNEIESGFDGLFDNDFLIASVRNWKNGKLISFEKLSSCGNYKRVNTGVIYYHKNQECISFINEWFIRVGYKTGTPILGVDCDQSIFNEL